MNEADIIELTRQTIWLAIEIATPVMVIGLIVGVIVALFQALTQIQEMTLAFVPKIIAIFMAIFLMLPAFVIKMTEFMQFLADQIIGGNLGS